MRRVRPGIAGVVGAMTLAALSGLAPVPGTAGKAQAAARTFEGTAVKANAIAKPSTKPKPSAKPSSKPSNQKTRRVTAAAAPRRSCAQEPPAGQPISKMQSIPWPQQRLGFQQAWKHTKGEGVTVAVVDSGVDTRHPQLRRARAISLTGDQGRDCEGHGTAVMGIIGAANMLDANVPFVGVAPAAKLLSVKFINGKDTTQDPGAEARLPQAIRKAAQLGAQVINVSVQSPDSAALRSAVLYAQAHDSLIVAAAGNVDRQKKQQREQPIFPASYPGVLSVGAVGIDGAITDFSNTLSHVLVSAPGENIPTTWPGGYDLGDNYTSGTSFAAPFVSGVAALVRSRYPRLTYKQVLDRIVSTADGANGTGSGAGTVNPYVAVTKVVGDRTPGATANPGSSPIQPLAVGGPAPVDHRSRRIGAIVAGGSLLGVLLAICAGVIIPIGRRRGWRPGRAPQAAQGE